MILGKCINISKELGSEPAIIFAQWIGSSNVVRNQKINEFDKKEANQAYAHFKKELSFLKDVPAQILRNAANNVYLDLESAKKGIRHKPKVKAKHKKRKCIITNELFTLKKVSHSHTQITFYTSNNPKKRKPFFKTIVPIQKEWIGQQIIVSRQGEQYTLSFSFDDQQKVKSNDQLLEEFSYLTKEELKDITVGYDRGVVTAVYGSNDTTFTYSIEEANKLKHLEKKRKKQQAYNDRQRNRHNRFYKKQQQKIKDKKKEVAQPLPKTSNNQKKIKKRIAKNHRKIKHIRYDFSHRVSKAIVANTPKICVFEDLKLNNMTKRPQPKQDENGHYLPNGASAKAGLNKAILNMALGQIKTFTQYKLNQAGKAYLEVPAPYTSLVHNACKGKNTERLSQSELYCFDCNESVHADFNASHNIKEQGIQQLLDKTFTTKKKKKVTIRKNKNSETNETPLTQKKG